MLFWDSFGASKETKLRLLEVMEIFRSFENARAFISHESFFLSLGLSGNVKFRTVDLQSLCEGSNANCVSGLGFRT